MACTGTPPIFSRTTSCYIFVVVVVDGHLRIECGCAATAIAVDIYVYVWTINYSASHSHCQMVVRLFRLRMREWEPRPTHTQCHTPFLVNRAATPWWLEAIKMVPANRIRAQRRFTKIYNESPFLRFVCHILAICAPTEPTEKWKTITAYFFSSFALRTHSLLV